MRKILRVSSLHLASSNTAHSALPSDRRVFARPSAGIKAAVPAPIVVSCPSEVAVMFRVNPTTVTRWARAGKISAVRTLGGHRRFRASKIRRLLEEVGDLTA
jgi:excisionase family DNA binding protein